MHIFHPTLWQRKNVSYWQAPPHQIHLLLSIMLSHKCRVIICNVILFIGCFLYGCVHVISETDNTIWCYLFLVIYMPLIDTIGRGARCCFLSFCDCSGDNWCLPWAITWHNVRHNTWHRWNIWWISGVVSDKLSGLYPPHRWLRPTCG